MVVIFAVWLIFVQFVPMHICLWDFTGFPLMMVHGLCGLGLFRPISVTLGITLFCITALVRNRKTFGRTNFSEGYWLTLPWVALYEVYHFALLDLRGNILTAWIGTLWLFSFAESYRTILTRQVPLRHEIFLRILLREFLNAMLVCICIQILAVVKRDLQNPSPPILVITYSYH